MPMIIPNFERFCMGRRITYNANPVDLKVSFAESVKSLKTDSPAGCGVETAAFEENILSLENLHTFAAFVLSV